MSTDPYARLGLTLEGWAFPGGSSRKVAARLVTRAPLDGRGDAPFVDIVDEADRVIAAAPYDEITIDPPLGRAPRRMHFPDEGYMDQGTLQTIDLTMADDTELAEAERERVRRAMTPPGCRSSSARLPRAG